MNNNVVTRKFDTEHATNIQPGNRISWLDILRGIGILLMVYGHINYVIPVYTWIYSFHMPLFFFAAGVVYKERDIRKDILHRALTLLIPYVFYGVITLLYWQFAERHYKPSDLSFAEAAKGLLTGNEEALDFNIPLWFLPCFFLTLVLYNLFRKVVSIVIKKSSTSMKQLLSFVFCVGLCVVYSLDLLKVLPWGIDRIPKYIIFVCLGEICAKILPTVSACDVPRATATSAHKYGSAKMRILAFLCTIPLLIASIILSSKLSYNVIHYQCFIVSIVGCAFVVALSIAISHSRILEFCGQSALLILCLHGPVYRALVYSLTNLTDKTMEFLRKTPAIITVLTLVTITLCLLVRKLMLVFLHRHSR